MGRVVALITLLIVASCDAATPIPTSTSPPPSVTPAIGLPKRLSSFPRPPQDNGWGVHWAPTLFAQPPEVVDYFVGEAQTMGIKWVKFLNGDSDKLDHAHLSRALVAHDMMPVMRVYQPFNEPYEHLAVLTRAALPLGVRYIELYNEPNVAGRAGGWRDGEAISVTRIAELWMLAADAVTQAGGYPGLPSLAPGGDYDDLQFLRDFLDELKARGRADLLQRAWLPLHNYFLNHPLVYPNDDVNLHNTSLAADEIASRRLSAEQIAAINTARLNARLPRAQGGYFVSDSIHGDSNGFHKFEAYERIIVERIGFEIPIISTEGGAIAGASEDPRYPPMTDDDVTATTLAAYRTMIESAPAYYFAFTPWLLANAAGGHNDPRFEAHAWYKDRFGTTLPVVTALKRNPLIGQTRRNVP